jgi:hypothetical protein
VKDGFLGVVFGLVLVALGFHALPNGLAAAIFLAGPRDETATADYLLTHKTADDYTAAAERALAAQDEDLAASIAQLATTRGVALPTDLTGREIGILVPLALVCLAIGFYPKPMLESIAPSVEKTLARYPELVGE